MSKTPGRKTRVTRAAREPLLQPLRVPTGWMVEWNAFFDVEPRFKAWDDTALHFGCDMLQVANTHRGVILDLDWLPSHRPRGRFVLTAVRIIPDEGEGPIEDWDHPLQRLTTRSKQKVVETLERWLAWYSDHALPRARGRARGTQ